LDLAAKLRTCILQHPPLSEVAKRSGISQATLQEFVIGKADGNFADIRLSSAQKLIDYFGLKTVLNTKGKAKRKESKMLLARELRLSGCEDTPEEFRGRLIDRLIEWFPETTIDELVCNPANAREYCRRLTNDIGNGSPQGHVMLKALMNIRRNGSCPVGLKPRAGRKNLQRELNSCGCEMDANAFKDFACDCLADMYKSRTIDDVLCYPDQSSELCKYARSKCGLDSLPDELILSTPMNVRKSSGK
jgi:hypothetical protein